MKIKNQSNLILKKQENIDEISRFLMVEYPVLLQQFNMREKYYEDDFHIIEYYMDKLVCETTIADKEELIEILGLETNREIAEVFYKNLLTCNHIIEGKQSLHATEWARNSVKCGKKQIEKTSKRKMYFDAINCKPLPAEFYKNSYRIRGFSEILNSGSYFINTWSDPNQFELQNAVLNLKGEERIRYNVPQELIDIDFDYDEYEKATEHVQFTPFYIALYKDGSFKTFDAVTYQEESFFRSILESNPSILDEIMISTGFKEMGDISVKGNAKVKIRILNREIPVTDKNLLIDNNGDLVYLISEELVNDLIQDRNYYILRQIYQFDRVCSGDDFLGSIVHLQISDSLFKMVEDTLIKHETDKVGQDDNELLQQKIKLLMEKRRSI